MRREIWVIEEKWNHQSDDHWSPLVYSAEYEELEEDLKRMTGIPGQQRDFQLVQYIPAGD